MDVELKRRGPLVLGLLSAAIAGLGTVQTLVQVASGHEFSLQQLAFWFGASASMVYIAAVAAAIVAGVVLATAEWLFGGRGVPSAFEWGTLVLGAVAGIASAAYVILQGVVFDYDSVDAFGRGAFGLLGIGAFAAGIWAWRRMTTSPAAGQ
ncbi:hypothetical protein GCM10011609_07200 [Lentzea pudingi]|uniref:Uncharacterized protein n=1 Tax=Lentzea pudingi TaxID=1789439 RepID=A0ABQ2HB71_9PSEU|nr:hypothetical protein [Lentzea pudingi]GGM73951.1 hypothetical protein GCM10011609_07200 [Lentzea pudingi]